MCGHFAINYMKLKSLIDRYGLEIMPPEDISDILNDSNFYPSRGDTHTKVPVVFETSKGRRLDMFRWDIVPSWWNKPLKEKKFSTFNARSESITDKASFKNAWKKNRRCIIPVSSFFEWPDKKLIPQKEQRIEHRITLSDQEFFSIAGLWEHCTLPGSESIFSCTLITVDANEKMREIPHTRMPAILNPEHENIWLDHTTSPDAAQALVQQYPAEKMVVEKYF